MSNGKELSWGWGIEARSRSQARMACCLEITGSRSIADVFSNATCVGEMSVGSVYDTVGSDADTLRDDITKYQAEFEVTDRVDQIAGLLAEAVSGLPSPHKPCEGVVFDHDSVFSSFRLHFFV